MKKITVLAVLSVSALATFPLLAGTTPLPASFAGTSTDYITFDGNSFPGGNEICFAPGCGGAFQATVYGPGATGTVGASTLTTVWCVDYQLDVTTGSQYIANITTLNSIGTPTDPNVRYANQTSDWLNTVTDPLNIAGGANTAAYRYTLAAALTSQYVDGTNSPNPTNLNGGAAVNTAIQEAIWYVTYNSDYSVGATWPPPGSGIGSATCGAGETNITDSNNYMCWVKYAEANAASVQTNQWAVISGPTDTQGNLLAPQPLNGNPQLPAYQTFLAQITPGGGITHDNPAPEPTYFVLTSGLFGLLLLARRRRIRKDA